MYSSQDLVLSAYKETCAFEDVPSQQHLYSTSCNLNTWVVYHVCSAQACCNWLVLLIKSTAWRGNPVKESLSLTFQLDGRILYVFLTLACSRNHILWVMDRSQGQREPNFCLPLPNGKWEKINVCWAVLLANITSEPFPVIQQKDLGEGMDTENTMIQRILQVLYKTIVQ